MFHSGNWLFYYVTTR
uniref:Uncharacterized protein n=1 Tax=Lepeophtheirus salmonis TaxID=72036 RepID=A0A0K2UJB3_LEPSM